MNDGKQLPQFRDWEGVNYRALYRVTCDIHERFNSRTIDDSFWADLDDALKEAAATYGRHPFLIAWLVCVMEEFERKAKALQNDDDTAI